VVVPQRRAPRVVLVVIAACKMSSLVIQARSTQLIVRPDYNTYGVSTSELFSIILQENVVPLDSYRGTAQEISRRRVYAHHGAQQRIFRC